MPSFFKAQWLMFLIKELLKKLLKKLLKGFSNELLKNSRVVYFNLYVLGVVIVLQGCSNTPPSPPKTTFSSARANAIKANKIIALEQTKWEVQLVRDKWQSKRPVPYFMLYARKQTSGATGFMSGQFNCSPVSGAYSSKPPYGVTFNLKTQLQECASYLADEADLLSALAEVTQYTLKENRLELMNSAGTVVVVAITY